MGEIGLSVNAGRMKLKNKKNSINCLIMKGCPKKVEYVQEVKQSRLLKHTQNKGLNDLPHRILFIGVVVEIFFHTSSTQRCVGNLVLPVLQVKRSTPGCGPIQYPQLFAREYGGQSYLSRLLLPSGRFCPLTIELNQPNTARTDTP